MPERLESEVLHKVHYINTLTFTISNVATHLKCGQVAVQKRANRLVIQYSEQPYYFVQNIKSFCHTEFKINQHKMKLLKHVLKT